MAAPKNTWAELMEPRAAAVGRAFKLAHQVELERAAIRPACYTVSAAGAIYHYDPKTQEHELDLCSIISINAYPRFAAAFTRYSENSAYERHYVQSREEALRLRRLIFEYVQEDLEWRFQFGWGES